MLQSFIKTYYFFSEPDYSESDEDDHLTHEHRGSNYSSNSSLHSIESRTQGIENKPFLAHRALMMSYLDYS